MKLGSLPIREEWLDLYGHVRWSNYLNAIDPAGYVFYGRFFGPVDDYLKRTGCAFYTAETHARYLKEVRGDAMLEIEGWVFGSDAKRIWWGAVVTSDGIERATIEIVDLHVDTNIGRSAPMPDHVQAALTEARVLEVPAWAGRSCSLVRK